MSRGWWLAVAVMVFGGVSAPAVAQTMPLNEFIATADRIPRNPTALLRSDYRRLKRELEAGMSAIATAQYRAQQANQPAQTCMPNQLNFDAEDMLQRLKAIPEPQRRTMTITDGLRDVIRRQYPCPGR